MGIKRERERDDFEEKSQMTFKGSHVRDQTEGAGI